VALGWIPRPLVPCEYTLKFQGGNPSAEGRNARNAVVYSHNCELDTPNIILTQRFETTAEAFPRLKHIDANPKAAAERVNGVSIQEYLVDLGMAGLSGTSSRRGEPCGMAGALD